MDDSVNGQWVVNSESEAQQASQLQFKKIIPGYEVREDKAFDERVRTYLIILLSLILSAAIALFDSSQGPIDVPFWLFNIAIFFVISFCAIELAIFQTILNGYIGSRFFEPEVKHAENGILCVDALVLTVLTTLLIAIMFFAIGEINVSHRYSDASQELKSAPVGSQVDVVSEADCYQDGKKVGEYHFIRDDRGNVLQIDAFQVDFLNQSGASFCERFEFDEGGFLIKMRPYVPLLPGLLGGGKTDRPSSKTVEHELEGENLKSYEAKLTMAILDMNKTRQVTPSMGGAFEYYDNGHLKQEAIQANDELPGSIAQYDESGYVTSLSFGRRNTYGNGGTVVEFEYAYDDEPRVGSLQATVPPGRSGINGENDNLVVETTTDEAGNVSVASWEGTTWELSYQRIDNPSRAVSMSPKPLSTLMESHFFDNTVGNHVKPCPYSPSFPLPLLIRGM